MCFVVPQSLTAVACSSLFGASDPASALERVLDDRPVDIFRQLDRGLIRPAVFSCDTPELRDRYCEAELLLRNSRPVHAMFAHGPHEFAKAIPEQNHCINVSDQSNPVLGAVVQLCNDWIDGVLTIDDVLEFPTLQLCFEAAQRKSVLLFLSLPPVVHARECPTCRVPCLSKGSSLRQSR